MKFRKSFVTNSSSSSYICEISGEVESGYDISSNDVGMLQCTNNHIFLEQFLIDIEPSLDEIKEFVIDRLEGKINFYNNCIIEFPESKSIENLNTYVSTFNKELELIKNSTDKISVLGIAEKYKENSQVYPCECPICSFNKISVNDFEKYIYKQFNVTKEKIAKEKIEKEIKNSFNSYKEFFDWLYRD